MTSLCESQAFLDQFDKVLPLCEKGDAVTVINALHVLNSITQASVAQAKELTAERDFVCSFLLELELALELYISPSRKLGTQDGGLPALYSFGEDEVAQLAGAPSKATKAKVLKFLDALGVAPSREFKERTVAETVSQFLGFQVKSSHPKKERAKRGNISWADQCSSGSDSDSDCSSLPNLEEEEDDDVCCSTPSPSKQRSPSSSVASVEEYEVEEEEEEEEEGGAVVFNAAASIFLSPAPFHSHADLSEHDCAHNASHSRSAAATAPKCAAAAPAARAPRPDPFFKTRLCKNYMSPAGCVYGSTCNFAHGEDDLRAEATLVALSSAGASSSAAPARAPAPDGVKSEALYKTRMCNNYEKHGFCKYNNACHFAHGAAELRRPRKGGRAAQQHSNKSEQDL